MLFWHDDFTFSNRVIDILLEMVSTQESVRSVLPHQKFWRKVCAIVDTSQILLVILNGHPYLRQWLKRRKHGRKATDSYLRIVQIGIQHDNRIRQDINSVLGLNFF
jgi:hypothetical protein